MSRGFVTIATGDDRFYELAVNLLRSYRFFSKEPMPFALICEEKKGCCKEFDDVILLENPHRSYLDKLCLPEYAPYDETIFIDSDCLALKDLNDYWAAFEGATDFSAFGTQLEPDIEWGWFRKEDAGVFSGRIQSIPEFIGGVYYLRKSEELASFAETCRYVLEHYYDFRFRQFEDPADETVYVLSMAVHGFTTAKEKSLPVCFFPHATQFSMDIRKGYVRYDNIYASDAGIQETAYMVHWGSGNTRQPVYQLEAWKINRMIEGQIPGNARVLYAKAWISTTYWTRRITRGILVRAKRAANNLFRAFKREKD